MIDCTSSPLPLTMFSPKSSRTIREMLGVLTLLMRPLIDFFRASQARR